MLAPKTFDIKKVEEDKWKLFVVEGLPIKRVLWIYLKSGSLRLGHATKKCEQILFAQRGEVQVNVEFDGTKKNFNLKSTGRALYVPAFAWRSYKCLSREAILLVICSEIYDEKDYIRDYEIFKNEIYQS